MTFTYLAIIAIVAFAILGFWRGWLREVATLAGLLLTWLVISVAASTAIGFVNRVYLIIEFTVRGGFDTSAPGPVLQALRANPLIESSRPAGFDAALLLILALASYLLATQFAPGAADPSTRILGALVGLANGYVFVYLALRYVVPAFSLSPGATPLGAPVDVLGRYLPSVLLLGVTLAIGIALLSSRRLGGRGSGRMSPGRARG